MKTCPTETTALASAPEMSMAGDAEDLHSLGLPAVSKSRAMEIETGYAVKLFFSTSTFVQVYFEAVANAFDAEADEVAIRIQTDPLEITIHDNGVGFTDERFERFARLMEPVDPYHKGLGRLVYLNYFSTVNVVSFFDGKRREFSFSNKFKGKESTTDAAGRGTTLRFTGFHRQKLYSLDDLKPVVLKEKLLEQFLPLFLDKKKRGQGFRIDISLEKRSVKSSRELFSNSESLTLSDVPVLDSKTFQDNGIDTFARVSMSYAIRQAPGEQALLTAACIDGRTIPIKLLSASAIPPNYAAIFLFESELFTGKSDSARQRLVLSESVSEATLHRVLRREMSSVLNEALPEIEQKNTKTKQEFEDRYPHLTGLFDEDTVGLIDRDEAIEFAQRRFFEEQRQVLESDTVDDATFKKSLEVSSRTLTEYILYREIIIKRLRAITGDDTEAAIHNLIVPRYKRFHEAALVDGIYNNNAWLLDDKFMSFRTILSEATMRDVVAALTMTDVTVEDDGRPDIAMVFSADPTQAEGVDVVVVELKRRTVDAEKNFHAATQLVQRAIELVNYYPTIQRMWYFAIVDIDQKQAKVLRATGWVPLFSRGHHVFYREALVPRADGIDVPTPICILSYDALIKDAAARNHTFLEILKSDFKRAKPSREVTNGASEHHGGEEAGEEPTQSA